MRIPRAIAEAMTEEGVDVVFSLMGDTNMELLAEFSMLSGTRILEVRHEGAAVAMAEGYARAAPGRVGVAAVTAGPGLANALLSLTESARSGAPVVVFTGPHSRDDTRHPQALHHEAVARLAGAEYVPVATTGAALAQVQQAFYLARAEGRTVVLDVPADIQKGEISADQRYVPSGVLLHGPQRIRPDDEALANAVALLDAAKQPVFVVGKGADATALEEIDKLADAVGALLITTFETPTTFVDHPWSIGVAGIFTFPLGRELLARADVVVSFGASLNRHTTQHDTLFPQARILQVDVRPQLRLGGHRAADLLLQADAAAGAAALGDRLPSVGERTGFRTPQLRDLLESSLMHDDTPPPDDGRVDPRLLCEALDELLPADCGVVVGVGHFWAFPVMYMRTWRTPYLVPHHFAAIGQGLALGMGVAAADPKQPLVIIEGDGSAMMNVHVLETIARSGQPILVLMMNDEALGAEFHKLRAKGYDPELSTSRGLDLAKVGAALGCRSVRVDDIDGVREAVAQFLADPCPTVVDVPISLQVVSQTYRRLHLGEQIQQTQLEEATRD